MLDLKHLDEAIRYEGGVSRRLFLAYGVALAALPNLAIRAAAAEKSPAFDGDPFSVGVASGDPDSTSVVLWTKLAPKPMEPNGGMGRETIEVHWELADDEAMKKVVARGTAPATPELGHSIHVEVDGLKPDRWYFYRFRSGDASSPVGRTRTLPADDANPDQVRFAFASCQNYEQGLFTAYEHMAKDDLDLVFHLGDYIYESPGADKRVRKHTGPEKSKIMSLEDYRGRHLQYRSDPLLHHMHAKCPWFVTWDDHEVDNNYANDISEKNDFSKRSVEPAKFLIQRAAAYQAYYEMMPLRKRSLPIGPDMLLYRKATFGRLAEWLVLDTRQYRTDQPNKDGKKPLNTEALDPKNSLLGTQQREWLEKSLISSGAKWNILAQQVMMGMVGSISLLKEPVYSMDQWPGAAHERMELVKFLADRKIANPVVITGDIHSNWVNNLRVDDRKSEMPVVATEFVGTSISSGGNGPKEPKGEDTLLAANPCVKFHNRQRGYVRCTIKPGTWTSDYVVIDEVMKAGGNASTLASFVVEAGQPGAKKA